MPGATAIRLLPLIGVAMSTFLGPEPGFSLRSSGLVIDIWSRDRSLFGEHRPKCCGWVLVSSRGARITLGVQ